MNRKQAVLQRRKPLLTIALVAFLSTCTIVKVHGMSAIVQSYEESTYMEMKNHQIAELVRCKIHISIETEHDGTWRNNTAYNGRVKIILDWYNTSLCPNGVDLLIHCPTMAAFSQYVNQTPARPYDVNTTLRSLVGITFFDFWFKTEDVFRKESVRIFTEMAYTVYNGSWSTKKIGSSTWFLPDLWITIMPNPQQQLQTEIVARMETLEKQLGFLSNLLNHVIILFVVSIIIYIATSAYIALRKPKINSELKTT